MDEPLEEAADHAAALASGWTECMTEQGERYYCNPATGETSWEPLLVIAEASSADQPHALIRSESFALAQQAMGSAALERLDPQVQAIVVDARLRQGDQSILLVDDGRVVGREQPQHWVEMYDPTHDAFYYYEAATGAVCWDKPESYVMLVENDAVLRLVVKLQCAFRVRLARNYVLERKRSALQDDTTPLPEEHQRPPQIWIEVFDPITRSVYYYCPRTRETRADQPELFITASEDTEMSAAIMIQCVTRNHLAKQLVKQKRSQLQAQAFAQVMEPRSATVTSEQPQQQLHVQITPRDIELPVVERINEFLAMPETEREGLCRREMIDQEMEQIQSGDHFWGIERYDQEVLRQQIEEQLLAQAELFWDRVNQTLRRKDESDRHLRLQIEAQRQQQQDDAQAREREAMNAQEVMQCQHSDHFWGIQREEWQEQQTRVQMGQEEERCRRFAEDSLVEELHRAWMQEAVELAEHERRQRVRLEKRNQKQYFQWFYQQCTTVDELLDYRWPSKQPHYHQQVSPSFTKLRSDGKRRKKYDPTSPEPSPVRRDSYLLDDLVVRDRIERGDFRSSIFTIHHPNGAQIDARKGHYEITRIATEQVFTAATATFNTKVPHSPSKSPAKQAMNSQPIEADREAEIGSYSHTASNNALLYANRARTPDPHIPARFNGIPFKPSQLNPLPDLFSEEPMKQNQIPSLSHSSSQKFALLKQIKTHHSKPAHRDDKHTDSRRKSAYNNNNNNNNSHHHDKHRVSIAALSDQALDEISSTYAFAAPFPQDQRWKESRTDIPVHQSGRREEEQETYDSATRARVAAWASQFDHDERFVLQSIFASMDYDVSGTVDKLEIKYALRHDSEIHALARRSALLRWLSKQPAHMEELFGAQSELSWDRFLTSCQRLYAQLMDQGQLSNENATLASVTIPRISSAGQQRSHEVANHLQASPEDDEQAEERKIRELFTLLDHDGNGVLELYELQQALEQAELDPALQRLVASSKALRPLLREKLFMQAFLKVETEDERGISQEEFVSFCLETASLAQLNGMLE